MLVFILCVTALTSLTQAAEGRCSFLSHPCPNLHVEYIVLCFCRSSQAPTVQFSQRPSAGPDPCCHVHCQPRRAPFTLRVAERRPTLCSQRPKGHFQNDHRIRVRPDRNRRWSGRHRELHVPGDERRGKRQLYGTACRIWYVRFASFSKALCSYDGRVH